LWSPLSGKPEGGTRQRLRGELALVFYRQGRVHSVDTVQITDGLITAYRRVINPDKLSHL
jgi:hypothetical protein